MLLPSLWGSRAPSKAPNEHPTGKEPGPDPGTGSQQGAPHGCWVRAGGRSPLLFSAELPHNHLFNEKPGSQKSGGQKQDGDARGHSSCSLTAPGGALLCAPSLPQEAPWHEGRAAGAENGTAGALNPAPSICASPEKAGRGLRSWGAPSPASLAVPPPVFPSPQSSATMESARSSLSLASFSRSRCSSLRPGWSICAVRSPKILCISV